MDNNELVICQGLTKNYGKKTALNNLNLTLGRGQFIGLLGPNGSGKTTTIKLLNGLLQPTSGSVLIDGQAPGTYTHSIISYLPDKNYLNDAMKVNDLISFFADFYTDFDRVKGNRYAGFAADRPAQPPENAQQGQSGEGAAHPHHEPQGAAVCAR